MVSNDRNQRRHEQGIERPANAWGKIRTGEDVGADGSFGRRLRSLGVAFLAAHRNEAAHRSDPARTSTPETLPRTIFLLSSETDAIERK